MVSLNAAGDAPLSLRKAEEIQKAFHLSRKGQAVGAESHLLIRGGDGCRHGKAGRQYKFHLDQLELLRKAEASGGCAGRCNRRGGRR